MGVESFSEEGSNLSLVSNFDPELYLVPLKSLTDEDFQERLKQKNFVQERDREISLKGVNLYNPNFDPALYLILN